MKFMGILAAAMLVGAPVIASADPASSADKYSRPAPGPVASQTEDDDFDDEYAAYLAAGGTLGFAAFVALLLAGDSSDGVDTTPSTPSTPSTPGT